MFSNKLFKFVILIILLTSFTVFSGCGGGNPVTPPIDNDDSEIPESTEAISQEIDLSIGGTVEVTDPENIIYGVKLIIPPIPSEKRGGKSTATMTISYIDNPYFLELPDNRGFLLPPVVINSDVSLNVKCTLEIPYTEAGLSNMGLSSNENIKVYRYNYISSLWEEVSINKRNYKEEIDFDYMLELTLIIEDTNTTYACSTPGFIFTHDDFGFPQPGDLFYRLSDFGDEINQWVPGHVGIYVGDLKDEKGNHYNVIEALGRVVSLIPFKIEGKVEANYYNPISEFAYKFNATYLGARQPCFGALDSEDRMKVLNYLDENDVVGKPYAWTETLLFLFGLARGDNVKGERKNSDGESLYNCVGLAEAAYEAAGVNLVSDWYEGNICIIGMNTPCVLTPAEQYKKTEPAEGYAVSGRVTDSRGNEIPNVTLNFELVTFNDNYVPFSSFEVTTNSDGYWSSPKLGREWNVTPQKDGYTFEPSTIKVKENTNNVNFTSASEPEILTPEEIELIRKWGYGGDYVVRWPNGYVDVYDATNYSRMQEVLNQWNAAIDGPVIFRLSNDTDSPVKIIFDPNMWYCGSSVEGESPYQWSDDYVFSKITIKINPSESCFGSYNNTEFPSYLFMFNAIAGFNQWAEVDLPPFDVWSNFNTIPDITKTMLRALHRVPPGYYLGSSKQRKDHSNAIIKNVFTSRGGNCLDEGKK